MDRETLYDLRSLIALHPYYQTARLLLLQNLYLLHDPTFDEELRRAAIYITDRKVLFNLVEAAHYQIKGTKDRKEDKAEETSKSSTNDLIDKFLDTIPVEEEKDKKRKPTAADAAIDYVAYLMEAEDIGEQNDLSVTKEEGKKTAGEKKSTTLAIIDSFISKNENGKIELKEEPEFTPEIEEEEKSGSSKKVHNIRNETICSDCGINKTNWLNITWLNLIWIECSSIHRSLGVQISKIKSLELDNIDELYFELLKEMKDINKVLEENLPDNEKPNQVQQMKKKNIYY